MNHFLTKKDPPKMSRFIHWINQNTFSQMELQRCICVRKKLDFQKAVWHKQRSLRAQINQTINSFKWGIVQFFTSKYFWFDKCFHKILEIFEFLAFDNSRILWSTELCNISSESQGLRVQFVAALLTYASFYKIVVLLQKKLQIKFQAKNLQLPLKTPAVILWL